MNYLSPIPPTLEEIAEWAELLPPGARILGANLFADTFIADEHGAVLMLEPAAMNITRIAASEGEFWKALVTDPEGWLLRPLVDRCRTAGLHPSPEQCLAFTTMPVFGGRYEVENIWLCTRREWLSATADMWRQIRDLPDGTQVQIRVVD
ncbi:MULTISPECIES: T6SS immunity protein Tdi1 domain-containing protein [unclassified Chelatococcus]|uniref:T6SS immunity protein Tdi1 domain-containing protein n=1 Tax=unclassified Chelatococcus TaxID=2638111 RepID=UPI001BCB58B8|nr:MULTISPECIES: T6SS immunity protein Tdi1 domain-containing protein [unclassified Chelatococcus]CAH1672339.1 conserved hypothetical protein [Hyphomicrobiales bacterium]MBS7738960.1 DUF1851 domain-containing protein [Chelatococcus sp. HY11]MBX3543393.1 DUF1851 domain-containing protein [Chelatococcus sp.]MCO5076510.1 DUF1851 domain-containing protein [Chelatococcus sp.]CAH1675429.1 conserved hypothetical protein [Hyphomicrobiales bacterium]